MTGSTLVFKRLLFWITPVFNSGLSILIANNIEPKPKTINN